MEPVLSAIDMLASIEVLIALLIGSVGGVIIGAVPGIGPPVAIAILLPATFALEPIVGLIMLLGVYGSSMYGGALPAVLINTPGTAVNALTTYDGYPMTQSGQPRRAVSLAYSASLVGGLFSVMALILLAPFLAKIAPQFGAREIFLVGLLGMILVIFAHRGSELLAAFTLCLGIFLNSVGLETIRISTIYTFDQKWLNSGFDLIVVVLGLFAISQALLLLTQPNHAPKVPRVDGGMLDGIKEVGKHKRVSGVASGFGVLMGMIPGVGEFTAQFLSYNYAQWTSKTPEKFGNGSPEGLIASEAANNAVPAAAMIPLLALGVPGEALTAMMLSVFYVHNVIPGPGLFQNNIEFVYALYIALALLNVIVFVFLIFFTNPIIKSIQIPTRFLGLGILTLAFVGAYSIRNSVLDCAIAAAFGIVGLIFKRTNIPVVPIILGMVLGGIMEEKLRIAMSKVEAPIDFISRPIAFTIFMMILIFVAVTIVWPLTKALRAKVRKAEERTG